MKGNAEVFAATPQKQAVPQDLPADTGVAASEEVALQERMQSEGIQQKKDDFLLSMISDEATYKDPDSIMEVQSHLNDSGSDVAIDGIMGPETSGAIMKEMTRMEGLVKRESPISKLTPVSKEEKIKTVNNDNLVSAVYNGLLGNEGASGDTTGAAPTGDRGLTTATYNKMKSKYGEDIDQAKASQLYISDINEHFQKKLPGYNDLPTETQIAIVDAGYNMSYTDMTKYKGFKAGVAEGNPEKIFKNLLDTANISSLSSKGLAKRRAQAFNKGNPDSPITRVNQSDDGTLTYYKGNAVYFSYKPKGGKHSSSRPGDIYL